MIIFRLKKFNEIISAFNNPSRKGKRNDVPEYWDIRKWPKAKILISKPINLGISNHDIEPILLPMINKLVRKIENSIEQGYIYTDPGDSPDFLIHYLLDLSKPDEIVYCKNINNSFNKYNYGVLSPVFLIKENIPYILLISRVFSKGDHKDQKGKSYLKEKPFSYTDLQIDNNTRIKLDFNKSINNPDKLGIFGLLGYKPREIKKFKVLAIDQSLNCREITMKEFQKVYDNYVQNNR